MEKSNKLLTTSMTEVVSVFVNFGQVLDFGPLLIDQLNNMYSESFIWRSQVIV